MRHTIANWFNEHGRKTSDQGRKALAFRLYRLASYVEWNWSVPWYNAGLIAKYLGQWERSLSLNQKAAVLDPSDEAAWWNLGIAATALHNWPEAARAWKACGIELLQDGSGEITISPLTACVRLNPNCDGEVVWGERIDPVRFLILSVPLPESGHRFRDIVLNDGAPNGEREWNGRKFPVFDELELWKPSKNSTLRVNVNVPTETAEQRLVDLCRSASLGIEDWGTVRMLCAQCSRATPAPHDCETAEHTSEKSFAFAAETEHDLLSVLDSWAHEIEGASYTQIEVALPA